MIIQENGGVDPTASTNKASSKKRKASGASAAKRNTKKANKKQTTSKTNLKSKGGKNGKQNKRQKSSKSRKAPSKKVGKMFDAADTPVSMKYGNSRNTNGLIMPENLQLDLSLFSPAGGLIPSPMPRNRNGPHKIPSLSSNPFDSFNPITPLKDGLQPSLSPWSNYFQSSNSGGIANSGGLGTPSMVSLQGTPSNFTPGPLGNLWMSGAEGTRLFESTPGSMKKPESPLNLLADIASSPAAKDKNDDFTMDMDEHNKLGNSDVKKKIRNGRITKKSIGKNSKNGKGRGAGNSANETSGGRTRRQLVNN